jgi:membrane protein involved in colicin uptake
MEGIMRISFLVLMSAMLLFPPLGARAQVAGPAPDGSSVAARSSAHVSIDWAKSRLDEMDATLASLEKKLDELKSDSRVKAERAIAEMREQREALKQDIEAKKQATEAEWQQTKARVESHWTAFEAAVQKWVDAAGERVAEQNEMFVARAEAQLKAWQDMIDKLEASAKGVAADRKREIDAAVAKIRADAEATKTRLEGLKRSGRESWTALSKALAESRAAFDRANQTASEAFKRATN